MGLFEVKLLLMCLLLLVLLKAYFRIAEKYNIIDKPNERSSHSQITIRGGGVLFPIAVVLWFFFFGMHYPWFSAGVLLISIISFIDDRLTLSTKPRLAVHLLSVALMLIELGFVNFPWYIWIIAFVLIIGWLNAFNFMDGINGITTFYALAVLLPLWYVNRELAFVDTALLYVVALSLLVFGFFNARKKAKAFAGDVGSVSMGFILAFALIALMLQSGNWVYVLFVSLYGIDAVLTIVQRLLRKENIFEAHRSHLYQYLANEAKWSHLSVSTLYALIQLGISALVLFLLQLEIPSWSFALLLVTLGTLYLIVKTRVAKKHVIRAI